MVVRCQRTGAIAFFSVAFIGFAMAERPIDPQPNDLLRIPASDQKNLDQAMNHKINATNSPVSAEK
jgi:hypothetical protein